MIRFVDLREADIAGGRFAFYDTVTDEFVKACGVSVWETAADFERDCSCESCSWQWAGNKERFLSLMPEWAKALDHDPIGFAAQISAQEKLDREMEPRYDPDLDGDNEEDFDGD